MELPRQAAHLAMSKHGVAKIKLGLRKKIKPANLAKQLDRLRVPAKRRAKIEWLAVDTHARAKA